MTNQDATTRTATPEAVTGVQLMQGIGHREARGFWAEAWDQTIRSPRAIFGLSWLGIVAFFAVVAPLIASGHPIIYRKLAADGSVESVTSPLVDSLTSMDWLLLIGSIVALAVLFLPMRTGRDVRLRVMFFAALQVGVTLLASFGARYAIDSSQTLQQLAQNEINGVTLTAIIGAIASSAVAGLLFLCIPFITRIEQRFVVVFATALTCTWVLAATWQPAFDRFQYRQEIARGEASAVFTLLPFAPQRGDSSTDIKAPGSNVYKPIIDNTVAAVARRDGLAFRDDPRYLSASQADEAIFLADVPITDQIVDDFATEIRFAGRLLQEPPGALIDRFGAVVDDGTVTTLGAAVEWFTDQPVAIYALGTDSLGQDVLAQTIHACRLSISIGLVSTSIAVVIGVTLGALMGYFGGWVDLVLYRLVEVFMAIPVLFLLIVAAGVLPRNTYVTMILIGLVSWTGAARFVRAEFMKLRDQDFVQSARSVGLPLHSVLFKHMLPNGVTPVLVEASFAIASAILAEAILSFLGLGPVNQSSWGKLLADATNQVGEFVWWLAIFPGVAIFLTVLAYNLIGETLRDAIDPKLKKARV